MKKYLLKNIFCLSLLAAGTTGKTQNHIVRNAEKSLQAISKALDTAIFVSRFESVETPCVYIDPADSAWAHPKRKIINSDYRVVKEPEPEKTGNVKCLSEYCARYLRFKASGTDSLHLTISGTVQSSYGYPVSSLMQILTFSNEAANPTASYFSRLLSSGGRFELYPENDKFRIWMVLQEEPYNKHDTMYGYVEIVKPLYETESPLSISIYFDQMSIEKGDKNNQVFLRFSSTSHAGELTYLSMLAYNILKEKKAPDDQKRYNAIYLENFMKDPSCKLVYDKAEFWFQHNTDILPNTDPVPPH